MNNLMFRSKEEAIARMNGFGNHDTPFVFLIDFEGARCLVEQPQDLPHEDFRFVFPGLSNAGGRETSLPGKIEWQAHPQSFDEYNRSFGVVRRNLYGGNSFLTNLTCSTPVTTNLSLLQIFEHSQARYKLWLRNRFTVFSPETFVRIENGFIYSHPMKGTIDISLPDARERLLNDVKETAEHATITDLIRNDLSRVASEVTVVRYRYLDELRTHSGGLLQMSSEIRGKLPADFRRNLGTLFFRLLPAGSITGAPKKKTVEIIREAENYDRGFYTGVMGYFDGNNLDSAVLIRFVEQDEGGNLFFKSGGGITFQSNATDEYEEMKKKIYVPIY